jgi:hypothetical protein
MVGDDERRNIPSNVVVKNITTMEKVQITDSRSQ